MMFTVVELSPPSQPAHTPLIITAITLKMQESFVTVSNLLAIIYDCNVLRSKLKIKSI